MIKIVVLEYPRGRRVGLRAVSPRGRHWIEASASPSATLYTFEGVGVRAARKLAIEQHRALMPTPEVGLKIRLRPAPGPSPGGRSVRSSRLVHLTEEPDKGRLGLEDERRTVCGRKIAGWKIIPPEHEDRFGWSGREGRRCLHCERARMEPAPVPEL